MISPPGGSMFDQPRLVAVEVVNPYGRELIRPKNETARLFCALLEQTTLTRDDIERIKRLGYRIEATLKTETTEEI